MDNHVSHTSYTPIPTSGFTDHETILTAEHLQTLEGGVIKNDSELDSVTRNTNIINAEINSMANITSNTTFVEYGYNGHDHSETDGDLTISRCGTRVEINGTLADQAVSNHVYVLQLSNEFQKAKQNNQIKSLSNQIMLTDCHSYFWSVRPVGGTISTSDGTQNYNLFDAIAYKHGATNNYGATLLRGGISGCSLVFENAYAPNGIHLALRINTEHGVVFDHVAFECMLQDTTNVGYRDIAPLETPYPEHLITKGTIFYDAGVLCKAIDNIGQGEWVFSKVVQTNIAQELANLNMPTSAGTYMLQVTIENGQPVYEWVAAV